MGFWFSMLLIILFIPLTMLYFGSTFSKKAPKDINYFLGYRTTRSMKNKDTWNFAHHYIGKIWFVIGSIILPISIICFLFCFNKDLDTIGNFAAGIILSQLVLFILTIISTENALKRTFDAQGNRIIDEVASE